MEGEIMSNATDIVLQSIFTFRICFPADSKIKRIFKNVPFLKNPSLVPAVLLFASAGDQYDRRQ